MSGHKIHPKIPPDIHLIPRWDINSRRDNNPVIRHQQYDYVPSVMLDGNYRMWWCGYSDGDAIFYSESQSLGGPWSTPTVVFTHSNDPMTFDGIHACDPSVIRVDAKYYMYYGGAAHNTFNSPTRIGVATSSNGINWERLNDGKPIIVPNGNIDRFGNIYGAGQPSVTYLDGKFYLIYTDTTGRASNTTGPIGAGQYVIRSTDPTFQTGVEELTQAGFVNRGNTLNTTTEFSLLEAYSVDLQFVDILDAFLVVRVSATNNIIPNTISLNFYNRDFHPLYEYTIENSPWTEGPGIVGRPDRHAVPSRTNPSLVPIDIFRSVGTGDTATWDLAHVGMDLISNVPQNMIPYASLYEGCSIECPNLPAAMVVGGSRLQFASFDPMTRLTRNRFPVTNDVYNKIPYGASMQIHATVLEIPDHPAGFVLDDGKLWPTDCIEIIDANQSVIDWNQRDEYLRLSNSGLVGPALRCLQ